MFDVIVIGSGTAGMTAALYIRRAGKTVLLFESEGVGGQIANSPRVENIPSIKSISGSDFSDKLFEQVSEMGAELEFGKVLSVEKKDGIFEVETEYGKYESKSVIIATGVHHKNVGIAREEELVGHGVSYCAVCDGAFYKGEDVVLVGDANTALQYGILLSNYCKKVYICTWMDRFFGDKALSDVLMSKPNVEWVKNVNLKEFVGEEVEACIFEDRTTGKDIKIDCKACFIAIGQIPDNKRFENIVDLDKYGYIISDETCTTKTAGVYVAGDTRTKTVRQLSTAIGDGAVAGTSAVLYVDKL